MLNFDILEKGLEIVSPPHFVSDFSRKMFPMSYSIKWPTFIVWLLLRLETLDNVCFSCLFSRLWCHKFWNQSYLCNHAVFLHDQKVKTKTKYLKGLLSWIKSIFIFLEGFQFFLRLESAPLIRMKNCVKSVRIWSYAGPHFPVFGMNT